MKGLISSSADMDVHLLPLESKSKVREVARLFPALRLSDEHGLWVVFILQRTSHDLLSREEAAEREKDAKFERFFAGGKLFAAAMQRQGYWADMTDPATGYPLLTERGGFTHCDLDYVQALLHYPGTQVGGCCVMSHPRFGTSVYPATLFVSAPRDEIEAALQSAFSLMSDG